MIELLGEYIRQISNYALSNPLSKLFVSLYYRHINETNI